MYNPHDPWGEGTARMTNLHHTRPPVIYTVYTTAMIPGVDLYMYLCSNKATVVPVSLATVPLFSIKVC